MSFNPNPNFVATRNAIFFKLAIRPKIYICNEFSIHHSPIKRYLDKRPYRMIRLPHSNEMSMMVQAKGMYAVLECLSVKTPFIRMRVFANIELFLIV